MPFARIRRWASGIQGQLVLGILAVVVVITLLNGLVSSYLHAHFFSESLDADTRQRIVSLARFAAELLEVGQDERTLAPLAAQLDSPAVRAIGLYEPTGQPLLFQSAVEGDAPAQPPTADTDAGVVRRTLVTSDDVRVWRYFAPVRTADDGPLLAVLQLDLSLAILTGARDRSLAVNALMLVVILAAGLAVSLLAARRIAGPIRQLARHAEAVSVTIPTTPVPATGAREIRALARALNRMLRNLRLSMARLRESEARYRGLFDRMPDVALELDAQGRVLAVNAAVAHLGHRPEALVGQSVGLLVAESDVPQVLEAVSNAVKTGALTTTSMRLRCQAPELRFGELRAALRERGKADSADEVGGEGPRLVAILRDVTERKRADDEVAHAQRVLSIHTLASGISHEFNNVMATIIGTGALLATRPDLPEEVERELKRIVDTARRGAALSSQVLTYARRTSEQKSSCDLEPVIRDTMDLLSRTLDKRIEILVRSPSVLPRVKGDPTRLQQVLLNLGINAGDAMPGGGTLTIETKPLAIARKADADRWGVERGDYVHIDVRDTGHGMDDAVLRRIFEPYFTTKQAGAGTGLGLSVVYGTIRGVGGGIDVESRPGAGTVFHLLLPVAEAGSSRVEVAAPRRRPSRERLAAVTGRSILVVEDEPDLRELARRVLERRGYRVYAAADGFEAEAIVRERGATLDLVLLDVNLPRRDGVATFDTMRALRADLRVVIVSAGGVTDQRISDLLRRGALTLLRKPYEFEELEEVVVQALSDELDASKQASA